MDINHFIELTELEQMNLLIVEGKTLIETDLGEKKQVLYQLYGFFVAVTFQRNTGKILKINSGRGQSSLPDTAELS